MITRTLSELAAELNGELRGDPTTMIRGVAGIREALPGDITFIANSRYDAYLTETRASAVICGREPRDAMVPLLCVDNPYLAFQKVVRIFRPDTFRQPVGVHPTAVVHPEARLGEEVSIGPNVVIERGAQVGARTVVMAGGYLGVASRVGDDTVLYPHVVIREECIVGSRCIVHPGVVVAAHAVVGDDCVVGEGSVLHPHVVLYRRTRLGARVEVHAGVVLGADGFGYATDRGVHHKIPQVGDVEVGDDVEIGALSAIDRALLGTTRIGAGTKVDNLVQVGHNVEIGPASILCGQAGVAGSARLGAGVVLAGQVGVAGHLTVGDGVQVASKSAVYDSVEPGTAVAGVPAGPIGRWRRQQALLRRLEGLFRRVRLLEKRAGLDRPDVDPEGEGES